MQTARPRAASQALQRLYSLPHEEELDIPMSQIMRWLEKLGKKAEFERRRNPVAARRAGGRTEGGAAGTNPEGRVTTMVSPRAMSELEVLLSEFPSTSTDSMPTKMSVYIPVYIVRCSLQCFRVLSSAPRYL